MFGTGRVFQSLHSHFEGGVDKNINKKTNQSDIFKDATNSDSSLANQSDIVKGTSDIVKDTTNSDSKLTNQSDIVKGTTNSDSMLAYLKNDLKNKKKNHPEIVKKKIAQLLLIRSPKIETWLDLSIYQMKT